MAKYRNKTKRLYCETLLRLSETQSLNSITATAIIREADTARQTFYNHFHDVSDLISYLPINYLETSNLYMFSIENVRNAFEYAIKHKSFFSQLPNHKGQNNFHESFTTALKNAFFLEFVRENMPEKEAVQCKMSAVLLANGITDLFLEWCADDLSWPIDDLLAVISEYLALFTNRYGNITPQQV